ncbi:YbaN family protein [soil metagenome]
MSACNTDHPTDATAVRQHRPLWLAAGAVCLLIGTIGIVVPLLPTVDFYVMAAFAFGRGDPRWERWLMAHPSIGPLVRDWRAHRSIPVKAKCLSTASLGITCAWSAHALGGMAAWGVAVGCCALTAYLWSRPSHPRHTEPSGNVHRHAES